MMRLVAIALLFTACGEVHAPAYRTKHGIWVHDDDGIGIAKADVEAATQAILNVAPNYNGAHVPTTVYFGYDADENCSSPRDTVAGCSDSPNGFVYVRWIDGFANNAFFHEMIHRITFKIVGWHDRDHRVFIDDWAQIPDMRAEYMRLTNQ